MAAFSVLLTGGTGMLGKAIQRLAPEIAPDWHIDAPGRSELDVTSEQSVASWLQDRRYDLVIHAAAKVGGIQANMDDPAGFLYQNMMMNMLLPHYAMQAGIANFIAIGSSCMYPRDYRQPLEEEGILAAPLEPTNEGYALAKISCLKFCAYISEQYGLNYRGLIPCNLYGPGDNFHPRHSHLLAAILRKVHEAKVTDAPTVEIWGDGSARREFLYVDDLARYILSIGAQLKPLPSILNTGSGTDHTVLEYYQLAKEIIGYEGEFAFNLDAPVGMQHKLMNSALARQHGWQPLTDMRTGMWLAYEAYRSIPDYPFDLSS